VRLNRTTDKKCGVCYSTDPVSISLNFYGLEQGPVAVRFYKRREVWYLDESPIGFSRRTLLIEVVYMHCRTYLYSMQ